ncbi:MAG TPA: CDP-alcohol phosphatidyltransferase family protein [Saprospiraceae bacterium]|nr:CDP-alcohol phosphatidyltransferase family protein [Saprospiraceae bacterium]
MTIRVIVAWMSGSSTHGEIAIFGPMMRILPNALTLCNLIAGSCAIAALFEGMPRVTLVLAGLCLVLDLLDGFLARRLKVSSALGVQLDSLADLVSFGVLPGCIVFQFQSELCEGPLLISWLPFTAFLIPAGVALRLARFNLDTRDRTVFYGLPTPSAATFLFGFLWMLVAEHAWLKFICLPVILYSLVLLLPLLMLSNIRLWSIKGLGHKHGKWILGGFLIAFILLLVFTGSAGVPLIVITYILFGIFNYFLKLY